MAGISGRTQYDQNLIVILANSDIFSAFISK
jgi:hypothetical protein